MTLAIAEIIPYGFYPAWHVRNPGDYRPDHIHGARCCWCDREVAVPAEAKGKYVACIYCGLDRGHVPAIDEPFGQD